jgi:hypothetical protein
LTTKGARALVVLALALAQGCSVTPSSPATSAPSPSSLVPATQTHATPSRAPETEPPWQTGTLDQALTTPALEYHSTGTHLIWASGARADRGADVAPDLFASEPGGTGELIYDNPNRDSRLEYISGYGTKVAFVEFNGRKFGRGKWKLWYEPALGQDPTLVDEGSGEQVPFFALSDTYLVWTAVHGSPMKSQLLAIDLRTMQRRTLAEAQPDRTQYWFPDIDGHLVVYGTVEPNADFSSDERHVYLLDLDGAGDSVKLDQSTSASEPAIAGDNVVWKQSDPTLNFLNAGSLIHYSIGSGKRELLEIPTPKGLGFTDPSVGTRYATAWSESDRALYLADLETGTYPPVMDLGETSEDPHDAVVRPDIKGNLLAYVFGPAGGDLELRWVDLPESRP